MQMRNPQPQPGPVIKFKGGKGQLHCKGEWDGNDVTWSLDEHSGKGSGQIAKVELEKNGGACEITIHLTVTGTSNKVTFDTDDPIWVDSRGCPPSKGINTNQIVDVSCDPKKLTFTDVNEGDEQTLFYQLNFVGAEALDPELKNGGGTRF